jgi:murein DD-endopeptidase MepM/ murein hydrolase activator NlpD
MSYHPVLIFPERPVVLDLRRPPEGEAPRWSVGRYDEDRAIYTQPLFEGRRTVHMGVDLGGPVGVAVHAFADAVVIHAGCNPAPGDYGPTLVTEQRLVDGRLIYALFGHLSLASLAHSPIGRRVAAGDVLGWLGDPSVNGGWPPHVHLQLSWERPATHDLPGAVAVVDRDDARKRYPDPAMILGSMA